MKLLNLQTFATMFLLAALGWLLAISGGLWHTPGTDDYNPVQDCGRNWAYKLHIGKIECVIGVESEARINKKAREFWEKFLRQTDGDPELEKLASDSAIPRALHWFQRLWAFR